MATKIEIEQCFEALRTAVLNAPDTPAEAKPFIEMGEFIVRSALIDLKRIADALEAIEMNTRPGLTT